MHYLMTASLAVALLASASAAMAETATGWSWAPIRNGGTLDAHLARADFARPNQLPVFALIEDLAAPAAAY